MDIEIKQKRPISFGIKVAIAVIIASIILGGLLRFIGKDTSDPNGTNTDNQINLGISNSMLVPTIRLSLNADAPEKDWTAALAKKINGQSEVQVDRGRVDVMTDSYAIEIDFLKKWHEGLGQAIHYGDDSIRIGVLALIDENNAPPDLEHLNLLKKIERLCIKAGVKLVLLVPANESS
ncbi:hypothetical protein [Candidatus Nitrotoga sp. M5]|uniref:hypothetical protein n=1 Tax=Candidatus Nitrotoga sp. M5 TaxID=2890409 RepID=UPI001EF74181|nr:hypothetical protein [Candidatus Nitrotoga sp. M5]CAH1388101.1 conserved hypothetical protein [Candidatus Nitrotoga sp. M5]